jgi:energy-coupling factor transporter ATP-binding protein EcfA2
MFSAGRTVVAPPTLVCDTVPVLPQILSWSLERPLWQQDALRRLVERDRLDASDYEALLALCKVDAGIPVADCEPARPLSALATATSATVPPTARLTRVHRVKNVNALRDDQSLDIALEGLTVVYGDNGAGKSGYARLLKQVCRARGGKDAVYPNVYEADASTAASAAVCFDLVPPKPNADIGVAGDCAVAGDGVAASVPTVTSTPAATQHEVVWGPGVAGPPALAQVSVFDSRSAAVYVADDNDVAYLPHGTDLFPKLVGVMDVVKGKIEGEIFALEQATDRFGEVPLGTKAQALLGTLHAPDARERVEGFATLSDEERAEHASLKADEARFRAENPLGQATALRLCAERLRAARTRLHAAEQALAHSAISGLREAHEALTTARAAATLAAGGAFTDAPVGNVDSDAWRALWKAAHAFATQSATPRQPFPPAAVGDPCVLCQQPVDAEAVARLQAFEEFVRGNTRAAVDRATAALEEHVARLHALKPESVADAELLDEIASLDEELVGILTTCTTTLAERKATLLAVASVSVAPHPAEPQAGPAPLVWDGLAHEPTDAAARLLALADAKAEEAARYEAAVDPDGRRIVENAIRELDARIALGEVLDRIDAEIERQARKAKLKKCLSTTNTASVTKRNNEVLREAISAPLADEFARQIVALDLTHLPIAVTASHAAKGKSYHTLALSTPKAAKVPTADVLSEGEHRCTALAAFFAEISLQDSTSSVVFDDPVSSLDHGRRRYVAQRLAVISQTRPVLVFTHDLVFLVMLQHEAEKVGVGLAQRYVRRDDMGAGVITDGWPWDGQNVPTRIGSMKTSAQRLPKLYANDRPTYDKEIRLLYGYLRDTWERSVEEVLFNGTIRRLSPEVQTLRLANLHRITEDLTVRFEAGMTKASAWIQGHDHPAELALSPPAPAEFNADLTALEIWVAEVKKLHKK